MRRIARYILILAAVFVGFAVLIVQAAGWVEDAEAITERVAGGNLTWVLFVVLIAIVIFALGPEIDARLRVSQFVRLHRPRKKITTPPDAEGVVWELVMRMNDGWTSPKRSFTKAQGEQLIKKLPECSGTSFEMWWQSEDAEAHQCADALGRVMQKADWSHHDETPVGDLNGLNQGVYVSLGSNPKHLQPARVLRGELEHAECQCAIAQRHWQDQENVGVIVWKSER